MIIYTKDLLIKKLKEIAIKGWVKNGRKGNAGGIGNTLEDLLGIKENNLPIPNAAEWELKTQRLSTSSYVTLFHLDPSPRAFGFVAQILLPKYGWKHKKAGSTYPEGEMSFRQTIQTLSPSDRGFMVKLDRNSRKVLISFDASKVSTRHAEWLLSVKKRIGLHELDPQPYWGFDDLEHKAGTKLPNCFYVQAEDKKERRVEYYKYTKIMMLRSFSFVGFLKAIERGEVLVDFDARSGHNHGTKFRIRHDLFPNLYKEVTIIL